MRSLIVGAAALLAVGTITPALAAPVVALPTTAASAVQALPAAGSMSVLSTSTTKKKKKKTTTTTKAEKASIENISSVRRGKQGFEIVGKVAKTDRTCLLKVKWHDGTTDTSDEVDAEKDKTCTMSIDVPDGRDAVGDATATLTVKDSKGKKVATAKKTFTVK